MLKDYIRALQTSFTTVTGLRDVLIKIFGKVDEDITRNNIQIENATTITGYNINTTFTKDNTRNNFCKVINNVVYVEINLTGVTATVNDTVLASIPSSLVKKSVIFTVYTGGYNVCNLKDTGEIVIAGTSITNQNVRIVLSYTIA